MSDAREQWSKALFNNVHFLAVAHALGTGPRETDARELQAALKLSQPAVHRVLVNLEAVALIERLAREGRTSPQRYRRVRHPFWKAAEALALSAANRSE